MCLQLVDAPTDQRGHLILKNRNLPGKVNFISLLLITFLAFVLSLYHLDQQSLVYDEGFSIYLARQSLLEIIDRTAADIHPPLYYYLLHFWLRAMGHSEFALRFLSLLFGVLLVPLAYTMGMRLFNRSAGLLAAFLVAISPFRLWYCQEVRMYTLVTFLCLLSSFLLLYISGPTRRQGPSNFWLMAAYLLISVAAVYTHYFVFFVIAFQFVYSFIRQFVRQPNRSSTDQPNLASFIIVQLLTVIAYLPWLRFVIHRFGTDISFWEGTLSLRVVLRQTLIAFSLGHTVPEETAWPIAAGYLAILVLAIGILLQRGAAEPNLSRKITTCAPTIYLLLYLIVPIALLYLVSYQRPKFHPRYLMLAWPPFVLLIAAGLTTVVQQLDEDTNFCYSSFALFALYLAATATYADHNLYFDPAFTKADFRGVARYVQSHISPDEMIILTSGHLYPVFTYYYHGDNWFPIPDEPTLSTEHTLNYSVAEELNAALRGARGVWIVLWQDEVVDPVGLLTTMLDDLAQAQLVETEFRHVDLRHYAVPEGTRFSSDPDIQHPTAVNFANRIKCLGYSQRGSELRLYWQALRPLDEDYKLTLRLRDENNHLWGQLDQRPTTYLYPTTRWKVGELLLGRYSLPTLPGTPPGHYRLEVGLYTDDDPAGLDMLDANGVTVAKGAALGEVVVGSTPLTLDEVEIPHPLGISFGGEVELLGYDLSQESGQAGDRVDLTLLWRVLTAPRKDYTLRLLLTEKKGDRILVGEFHPANEFYPTSRWLKGEIIRGQYAFIVPMGAAPSQAQLEIELWDEKGSPLSLPVFLARFQVEATERVFTVPTKIHRPSEADLGGVVTLLGADLEEERVRPGGTLRLILYWRGESPMDKSYTVFVHLLDADSYVWAHQDSPPVGGARPTTGWVPGEVIADWYELQVQPDAPTGAYVIEVGMYDATTPDLRRLPVRDGVGQTIGDRVLLGEVQIGP